MTAVEAAWHSGLTLWGYPDWGTKLRQPIPYQPGLEINWVAAEPRPSSGALAPRTGAFENAAYHCEASIYWSPIGRRAGSIDPRGLNADSTWVDVEIRNEDLERLLLPLPSEPSTLAKSEPAAEHAVAAAPAPSKPDPRPVVSRRPPRLKPFWGVAEGEAITWLDDNGHPASGDGNQGELERHIMGWLEYRGHKAGVTTVRRYVGKWIEEYRIRLGV